MTNQLLLVLLTLSVLSGLVLLRVRRNERRRQFARKRLDAMTVSTIDTAPRLSLVRASSIAAFQLPSKFGARLDTAFEATGNRIGILHLLIAGCFAALIVIVFASGLLGLNPVLVMMFASVAAGAAPVLLLWLAQSSYQNWFLAVFPDALDLIARGVKAGLPVNEAVAVAGREIADPVGSELRRALEQVQIGAQIIDALQQVSERVRVSDFRFMIVALALQARTGGSLAETLTNLSGVIRARKALRLKARSLMAEAKISAIVLALLPFAVGGALYVMDRDMALMLWDDSRGRFILGLACISLLTGLSTMYVIVKRALR
jgi:tight adherence protein B